MAQAFSRDLIERLSRSGKFLDALVDNPDTREYFTRMNEEANAFRDALRELNERKNGGLS